MSETVIFSIERFGRPEEPTAGENRVGHLRATTWAASGHHLFGSGSKSSWCWTATWPAPSVASGELPAFGSNSS